MRSEFYAAYWNLYLENDLDWKQFMQDMIFQDKQNI